MTGIKQHKGSALERKAISPGKRSVERDADRPAVADEAPSSAPNLGKARRKTVKIVVKKFGMSEAEFQLLKAAKQSCAETSVRATKNQLLRAGIVLLAASEPDRLQRAMEALVPLKVK